jgi:hypothetical protein
MFRFHSYALCDMLSVGAVVDLKIESHEEKLKLHDLTLQQRAVYSTGNSGSASHSGFLLNAWPPRDTLIIFVHALYGNMP